jgi:hypothetical protein
MVNKRKIPGRSSRSTGLHGRMRFSRNRKAQCITYESFPNNGYIRLCAIPNTPQNEILTHSSSSDTMFKQSNPFIYSAVIPKYGWDGSRIERRYHSGRTDVSFGHNDYQNQSGLGPYHYHHTMEPHIPCNHFKPLGESLIGLFNEYKGSAWTVIHTTDGRRTYSFHAVINVEQLVKSFALEITARLETSEFYIMENSTRTSIEPFFGTRLNPQWDRRDGSPWSGASGGFDYLVDAEHFHELVNKYTGIPEPVHQYVTMDMLKEFGWQEELLTTEYMDKLNRILAFYNIIDMRSIKLFLATCGHESGKGNRTLERLKADGTTVGRYEPYERGAGYIQITGRDVTHLRFLASINDPFTGQNTAEYISENYPWEASAWYWAVEKSNLRSSLKQTTNTTLNDFAIQHGESLTVFLLVQYAVNGWRTGTPSNELAVRIRDGANWYVDNGRLFVEGEDNSFLLPNGWTDRELCYYAAINTFK